MSTFELFLAGALIGYLATLSLTLILLLYEQRRRKRVIALGNYLQSVALTAIARYNFAKGVTNRDEWLAADRAVDVLENAIERWDSEVNGGPSN